MVESSGWVVGEGATGVGVGSEVAISGTSATFSPIANGGVAVGAMTWEPMTGRLQDAVQIPITPNMSMEMVFFKMKSL